MSAAVRAFIGLVLLAMLLGGGWWLLHRGVYGWTIFALCPVLLGGLASWVFRPETWAGALGSGVLGVMAPLCFVFFTGSDGLICIAMALPLTLPLGILGSWLVYQARDSDLARPGIATFLLLSPASITWDITAPPPVFDVQSAIEIAAAPEQVWKHVVTFSELPEPDE